MIYHQRVQLSTLFTHIWLCHSKCLKNWKYKKQTSKISKCYSVPCTYNFEVIVCSLLHVIRPKKNSFKLPVSCNFLLKISLSFKTFRSSESTNLQNSSDSYRSSTTGKLMPHIYKNQYWVTNYKLYNMHG